MGDVGSNVHRSLQGRDVLEFKDLLIELDARRVVQAGTEISLTKSEFDLLIELARNAGIVLSPQHLFASVWGTDWIGDGHVVEVQISRLRRKLGESSRSQRLIKTIRSAGYRFDGEYVGPIVTLVYDRKLRVTEIHPKDRPFFGWDPDAVIGTYFILAAGQGSTLAQPEAIDLMNALVASGPQVVTQVYAVRCADGTTAKCRALMHLHADAHGRFAGAHLEVS